jgi:predicted ATPase/class 3 adenylate cyclase
MGRLPEGSVTFLFSDIAGSTRLLQELGEGYADVLLDHRAQLREVFARHDGVEVDTAGDSFFVVFRTADDAAGAALDVQEALRGSRVRVRIGLHTGEPTVAGDGYVGIDVHRAARISSVVHGGQVVLSERTRSLLADDADVADLGRHRLKDLGAPEHLFQLGPGDFPPLRSLNATNLPEQASALIGREREVNDVGQLLADRRVVTLTGPGGSGKTRLAIQSAAEVIDRFPDGVFWVPLGTIEDPALVPPTIAESIGTDRPPAEYIDDKHLLLVLDNLEQVLDAAAYISSLVERCPNLRVLVTSRAPLRISGEKEYAVEPLPEDDAVALFRERAFVAEPLEAVAEICRRVDRLPLAVELAAARTRMFSPPQLLARLGQRLPLLEDGRRDAPERHRGLRATITWSHDLLRPEEKELFARLSVFVGSFDVDVAEHVADAELGDLEQLVETSMVRHVGDRFSMLETIREYAVDQLESSGLSAARRDLHLEFFVDLAEQASAGLDEPESGHWFRRLEVEQDNIRAALGWAIETGAREQALRLCTGLTEAWLLTSRLEEGTRWFDQALALDGSAAPTVQARAALEVGRLLMLANRQQEARARLEEGIAMSTALGDDEGVAKGRVNLAIVILEEDPQGARWHLEDGLAIFRRTGSRLGEYRARHLLGETLRDLGEPDEGASMLARAIDIADELDSPTRAAATSHSLADLELDRGDLERAKSLYLVSLRNAAVAGIPRHKVYCIAGLAAVAARRGRSLDAARLWSAVERDEAERGYRLFAPERARYERALAGIAPWTGDPVKLDDAVDAALAEGC